MNENITSGTSAHTNEAHRRIFIYTNKFHVPHLLRGWVNSFQTKQNMVYAASNLFNFAAHVSLTEEDQWDGIC